MPQPPIPPVAPSPTPPVAAAPTGPSSPATPVPPPMGTNSFTTKSKPVAPDSVAPPVEGSVAHRAMLVQAALRVIAEGNANLADQDALGSAFAQLRAIGLCKTPLMASYHQPLLIRGAPGATPAVPSKAWELAPWADDVVKGLLLSAQRGHDDAQRSEALGVAALLLRTYRGSHGKFVQEKIPRVRELALSANKNQWPQAAELVVELHDTPWVTDLVKMIVEKKTPRAVEILMTINLDQAVALLQHPSADVRQLVARFAAPQDVEKMFATADVAVRRSIVQAFEKMLVVKGSNYSAHRQLLFTILFEDPDATVSAAAGRAWIHFDNRLPINLIVRLIPVLRGTDPQKVAKAARDLLHIEGAAELNAAVRAQVERVAHDEKVSPEVRAAVSEVLRPRPVPVKAVAVTAAAPAAPQDPMVEWAARSAALIEGGGLLTLMQGPHFYLMLDAIMKISRTWEALAHVRSAPLAGHLTRWAETLPADPAYQVVRNYTVAWALRLNPQAVASDVMRVLQNQESPTEMKVAAIFALARAPSAVPEVQKGRQWVADQFLVHLTEARALTVLDYEVMSRLADFADVIIPRASVLMRWIQSQKNPLQDAPLRALGTLALAADAALQAALRREVTTAQLGVHDLYILARLGGVGVTRLAELAEGPELDFAERRRVMTALVKQGDAARPELVDLLSSDNHDARFIATMALVWAADVTAEDLSSLLSSGTEEHWRMMADSLITSSLYESGSSHFLKAHANTPENMHKQIALVRLMAAQSANPAAADYQREIAAAYFKVMLGEFPQASALKTLVACLPDEELRPMAEEYLLKKRWNAVVPLHEAWLGTGDEVFRAIIVKNLRVIGDWLVEDILSDRVSKDFINRHSQAMQVLAPHVREGVMQQAARNPKAAIAWAEHVGVEGAALVAAMSQLDDPRIRKMAEKASLKMGRALLNDTQRYTNANPITPEAAFRVFEAINKK